MNARKILVAILSLSALALVACGGRGGGGGGHDMGSGLDGGPHEGGSIDLGSGTDLGPGHDLGTGHDGGGGMDGGSGSCGPVTIPPGSTCGDPVPALTGTMCMPATVSCINACMDTTCINGCLASDSTCAACLNQNSLSCETTTGGCMSQWVAYACCAEAAGCLMAADPPTCAMTMCSCQSAALDTCAMAIPMGTCTTTVRSCLGG